MIKNNIKTHIYNIIYIMQIVLLYVSYGFFYSLVRNKNKFGWVIGVSEIASMLYFTGKVLKPSVTVCLDKNPYYDLDYDYSINTNNKYLSLIIKIFS